MHPFSVLTLGIFIAGYITARWDLVTRLYELAIFAWDHGVVTRAAKGAAILSVAFVVIALPVSLIAEHESKLVSLTYSRNLSRGRIATTDWRSILGLEA
ncbi:hypothetical protein IWX90DRAFT_496950 [Phyllosticta citrichinensis]|uniref:Uncharacterized protein n=1 Tax=Phyllosticta citrichinensis TaxID=1130410 RepID=A0ABR1Y204_9PEZI